MSYTNALLRDEYLRRWSAMEFKPGVDRAAEKVAKRLLSSLPRYLNIQNLTGVPAAFTMVAHQRESDGDFSTYLGNGQPLSIRTTIVPTGRGPFKTFEEGAIDAYTIQKLNGIKATDWDESQLCFWLESFNGFGYRNLSKPIPSPYLWAGTNQQKSGKFVRDGRFDPSVMDPQLGGMAVYAAIVKLQPQLDLGGPAGGPTFLSGQAPAVAVPAWPNQEAVRQLQAALNALGANPPLAMDGKAGGKTRTAIEAFATTLPKAS